MMASKNQDLLAQQDWEGQMKDVFKEAAQRFKVLKKSISNHDKVVEKARKVAAQAAKKAECEEGRCPQWQKEQPGLVVVLEGIEAEEEEGGGVQEEEVQVQLVMLA